MATTLSEFYTGQGKALPSVQDRQQVASQAGIQNYIGTAQQNTQLLGYLQNQGNTAGSVPKPSVPPTIPAGVATGNVQPADLPNKPVSTAPADVYSGASAYLNSLPKTGVAGLDNTLQAMQDRPGQLAQQYDIANKQTLANEAKFKLDSFNEQYRVQQEKIRTEGGRTLEQINSEVNAIERTRAFTAGTLAIEAAFRANDFQGAQSLMNQQAQLELEPLKMRYDFFKDMYNRTEDQKFQRAMKAEERAYQTKKDAADSFSSLKSKMIEKAIENGTPQSIISQMVEATDTKGLSSVVIKNNVRTPHGTDTQFQSASYANRQEVSNIILDDKLQTIKNMGALQFKAAMLNPINATLSPEMQQFKQAAKNYITAQLRKESGAAISPSEMSDAIATYIPAPGDSDVVLEQKRQARVLNTQNLIKAAGTAYSEVPQELLPKKDNTSLSGSDFFSSIVKNNPVIQASTIFNPQTGFIIPGTNQ